MKKLIAFVLAAMMVCTMAACGGNSGQAKTSDVLSFKSGSAELVMNSDATAALAALGEAKSTFREESCAGLGYEITYKYSGFELVTYQADEGETEYVFRVFFTDDSVATVEGVRLGDAADKVVEAYGTGTATDNLIEVVKGNCTLSFVLENGTVSSIEYMANDAVTG